MPLGGAVLNKYFKQWREHFLKRGHISAQSRILAKKVLKISSVICNNTVVTFFSETPFPFIVRFNNNNKRAYLKNILYNVFVKSPFS